ncbi:MAG TPA: hypothetical protein VN892_12790 [Solirubrobacteraceae bacterium]|nr:hypothetical protein [Solirubrobacteraceae bacterium]
MQDHDFAAPLDFREPTRFVIAVFHRFLTGHLTFFFFFSYVPRGSDS